jgi:hypothetical protein
MNAMMASAASVKAMASATSIDLPPLPARDSTLRIDPLKA